jgi:serine protease Do
VLRIILISGIICGLPLFIFSPQTREEKVRADKSKVEAGGYWIYNDLPKAFAEAKLTRKPIIAVLRCIPCVECVKLDDDLIDADPRLKPLLAQFVRVRIISTNGLDLSLFQFDTDQSFAVFLLSSDGTILGRFGTRSHRTNWSDDVSVEGLGEALRTSLVMNDHLDRNRASLAGKRGPAQEFAAPEQFPNLKDRYKSNLDYQGKVAQSCIHCHMIGDAVRELAFSRKVKLPDKILFPYPHPKSIGLILDPTKMATVKEVDPGSPAAKCGLVPGDEIRKLDGEILLSIADIQWVLNSASPDGAEIKAEVNRGSKNVALTLKLENGWRRRDDISWRASTWGLRRKALGGMLLEQLPDKVRSDLKLPAGSTTLLVKHVGEYAPHNVAQKAGFRKEDIVIGFDSRTDLLRETDVIAYSLREKHPGDKVPVTILRNGERQTLILIIPEG